MTYIRVSGFKIFKDRHGKQRCYHRKTGIKIDLERAPIGSAAFIVTTQPPVPTHAPDQPVKVEPVAGVLVTVTTVPWS